MCSTPKSSHTSVWHTSLDHVQTELTTAQYAAMARVQPKPKRQPAIMKSPSKHEQDVAQAATEVPQPASPGWWQRWWQQLRHAFA